MRSAPRLTRALPWLGLGLAVLIFYWVEASVRSGPWLFSDELEWSQLSRAIASTGHAARRTAPHSFESLYSYLIAPAWWIHSTATAYAAIKYLNSAVMCLTAVPAYLLARRLVSQRAAVVVALLSIAIPAMSYATSIVPEPLAYLWFTLSAYTAVRALAAPTVKTVLPAVVLAAAGALIRSEFIALPAALVVSGAVLWIARGGASRALIRRVALSCAGLALFAYLFNHFVVMRVQSWNFGQYFNQHTVPQGSLAAGALAIGLGIGPVIGGLASLWLPERVADPAYRAYAIYLPSVIVTCWAYTAAKSTYLLVNLQNLIEERNLFFLAPLLLLGTAMVLQARRVNWYLLAAATALVLAVSWSARFEGLGAPYYEAPGLAISTLLNRACVFTVADVHAVLVAAAAVTIGLVALRRRHWAAPVAAVLAGAWLLTGEIYETKSNDDASARYANYLAPPRTWIDASTHGAATTFLGVQLNFAGPVWLTEFWNRSIDHVYALDDSAPPPGPIAAPYLLSTDGALADYTGDRYTVTSPGFELDAPVVTRHGPFTLYSTPTPWHLRDELVNVTTDGWGLNPFGYAYFPRGGPGVLRIDLSRTAYNGPGPPAHATIEIGAVRLDRNQDASLGRLTTVLHATVRNGKPTTVLVHVRSTPVFVSIVVSPRIPASIDTRRLAAQPAFTFTRDR